MTSQEISTSQLGFLEKLQSDPHYKLVEERINTEVHKGEWVGSSGRQTLLPKHTEVTDVTTFQLHGQSYDFSTDYSQYDPVSWSFTRTGDLDMTPVGSVVVDRGSAVAEPVSEFWQEYDRPVDVLRGLPVPSGDRALLRRFESLAQEWAFSLALGLVAVGTIVGDLFL